MNQTPKPNPDVESAPQTQVQVVTKMIAGCITMQELEEAHIEPIYLKEVSVSEAEVIDRIRSLDYGEVIIEVKKGIPQFEDVHIRRKFSKGT